jgi:hypothetical protein
MDQPEGSQSTPDVMAQFIAQAFGSQAVREQHGIEMDLERVHLSRGETPFQAGRPG